MRQLCTREQYAGRFPGRRKQAPASTRYASAVAHSTRTREAWKENQRGERAPIGEVPERLTEIQHMKVRVIHQRLIVHVELLQPLANAPLVRDWAETSGNHRSVERRNAKPVALSRDFPGNPVESGTRERGRRRQSTRILRHVIDCRRPPNPSTPPCIMTAEQRMFGRG